MGRRKGECKCMAKAAAGTGDEGDFCVIRHMRGVLREGWNVKMANRPRATWHQDDQSRLRQIALSFPNNAPKPQNSQVIFLR